jgi:hypothetical protein
VVEKTKDNEPTWRCGALQGILKEAHSLFAMFHGPIRTLLDRQPSAELARGHLRTFLTDYLSGGSSFPLIFLSIWIVFIVSRFRFGVLEQILQLVKSYNCQPSMTV